MSVCVGAGRKIGRFLGEDGLARLLCLQLGSLLCEVTHQTYTQNGEFPRRIGRRVYFLSVKECLSDPKNEQVFKRPRYAIGINMA